MKLFSKAKVERTADNVNATQCAKDIFNTFAPPGHFYSPFPNLEEIEKKKDFFELDKSLPGINLNDEVQLDTLSKIASFYGEMPFGEKKKENLRYYFNNSAYCHSDAITLYGMLRYLRPQKVIEVGCGFSSCVTLDTNELFFDNKIETEFIEPYPDLLYSLIKKEDLGRIKVISKGLQEVPIEEFYSLKENDVLFIDSTHVSKMGSDVNYVLHSILPVLKKGVYVHFHDIFYPFEYPKEWLYEGRAWNEAYILHCFLQFNDTFEIVMFNTYLEHKYEDFYVEKMPICLANRGASLWLKKVK